MTERCARITVLLALLPLIPAAWALALALVDETGIGDSASAPATVVTLLALAVPIATWRKFVRWTVIRSLSTAGLTALVLLQVVAWQPLWAVQSCGMKDVLITAQSLACLGIWGAGCALLWWGVLLSARPRSTEVASRKWRLVMTPNAVRLAIGIALMPFLPGLFWIVYVVCDDLLGWHDPVAPWLCYTTCAVVAATVWVFLWRRAVPWTATRIIGTALLAVLLLASSTPVFFADAVLGNALLGHLWSMICNLAPLPAFALWLAGTARLWRTDRLDALPGAVTNPDGLGPARCPECGYSLTGLCEVRCPECGWASTVDDIVIRTVQQTLAIP